MPGTFNFASDNLATDSVLFPTIMTAGSGGGLSNNPAHLSAITSVGSGIDGPGDVDVFAVTLTAGQVFTFDIDGGAGDSRPVDVELTLVDFEGNRVAGNDDGGRTDPGSTSGLDPLLTFRATHTGVYFVAVHHFSNDYADGGFSFSGAGTDTGDYRLVVSTPTLPPQTFLTGGADVRVFNDGAQRVLALGGNDDLRLGGGNDIAAGGDGNDRLLGEAGNDQLSGDAGRDRLDGGIGNDALVGGIGNDVLIGGAGLDEMSGGNEDDFLNGGGGDDRLWGDIGDDTILGGSGDDFIRGGIGIDEMAGGAGADTFHFLAGLFNEAIFNQFGGDAITDFSGSGLGGDLIDLSDAFAGTLTFIGTAAFTGAAGQVRVQDFRDPGTGAGFQQVRVDLDGDTTADMGILVDYQGSFNVQAGDFIL